MTHEVNKLARRWVSRHQGLYDEEQGAKSDKMRGEERKDMGQMRQSGLLDRSRALA